MTTKEQAEMASNGASAAQATEAPAGGAPEESSPKDSPKDSNVEVQQADELGVDELQSLREELEQAQARASENWDKLLRAQADIDNLRKRNARDLDNAHKYAIEKFAAELLGVRDSLELGLDAAADAEKLREGTELTLKMLTQAMTKFNIEQVDPAGEAFDPERHQAMTLQENSELAPNTVMAVMQKGYLLNERLLRPAMVIVSRAPLEQDPKQDPEE